MLDAGSLTVLGQHFERLMGAIQTRVETVSGFFLGLLWLFLFRAWAQGLPAAEEQEKRR